MLNLASQLACVLLLAFCYRVRGGWDIAPLPNWPLQLFGRLVVWGGGLATAFVLRTGLDVQLFQTAAFVASGFVMMLIPHRFCMTAGMDVSPPNIIKPNLADRWPCFMFPALTQVQWDAMKQITKTFYVSAQLVIVMILRCVVAFVPFVLLGGNPLTALLASLTIVSLVPVAHVLGFCFLKSDKPFGSATAWEEIFHGAVWGLAFAAI